MIILDKIGIISILDINENFIVCIYRLNHQSLQTRDAKKWQRRNTKQKTFVIFLIYQEPRYFVGRKKG